MGGEQKERINFSLGIPSTGTLDVELKQGLLSEGSREETFGGRLKGFRLKVSLRGNIGGGLNEGACGFFCLWFP